MCNRWNKIHGSKDCAAALIANKSMKPIAEVCEIKVVNFECVLEVGAANRGDSPLYFE